MHKEERDPLDVLKFELSFLAKGGYGRSPREPWRPVYIFEDSPTCMNNGCKENPVPCSDCVLMQLVPPELRFGKAPCHQIPLNAAGETLESLYRYGDEHEIEETVRNWLTATIEQLEERGKSREFYGGGGQSPARGEVVKGTALHQGPSPKCANPSCPIAFSWQGGGKFFRFRAADVARNASDSVRAASNNSHGVKHFWLCEGCTRVFTLSFDAKLGVVLKL